MRTLMKIIGVDTGNMNMKTAHYTFTSGLYCHENIEPAISTEVLLYEGKYYSLADNRVPYRKNKTEDNSFYILTLFAIAKELLKDYKEPHSLQKPIAEDVVLAMGLPPSHMGAEIKNRYNNTITSLKNLYKPYFGNNGNSISFIYEGQAFVISVVDVKVYPQGIAAVAANKLSRFADMTTVHIVDIGGYTTDWVTLNKGKLKADGYRSFTTFGVIQIYNEIRKRLEDQFDDVLTDVQIESIMRFREPDKLYNEFSREIVELVHNTAEECVRKFFRNLEEEKISLKVTPSVFMGGGSKLLRRFIVQQNIRKPEFISEINANAVGYELLVRSGLND